MFRYGSVARVRPILFVSGADLRSKAFEAGTSAFLNYDAWLRFGVVEDEMLRTGMPGTGSDQRPDPALHAASA